LIPSGQTLADGRPIFGAGRIEPRFNGISLAGSVGNSLYSGGTFTLSKRVAKGLESFASYTWA